MAGTVRRTRARAPLTRRRRATETVLVGGLLAEAGVTLEVSFGSADLATIEGLVAAGLGLALVPEQFAGLTGSWGPGHRRRGAARRTVGVTWRTDRELAPPAARFLSFVRDASTG